MPGYPGNNLAKLLYENKQHYAWNAENISAGESSEAFELRRTRGNYYPFAFSVEVAFSGAPGTFEIDVQTADSDLNANYVTLGKLVNANMNSSNVGRIEVVNVWCKFMRLNCVAFGNAGTVAVTALVTR